MPTDDAYKKKYTNSWAFIVGINDYKKASPLSYAKNDAEGIAKILKEKFHFPEANISLLIDENATQKNIRDSFNEFTKEEKIQPDDRLLVFYAGHGHTLQGKRGEVGFLVPVDGDPEDIRTLIRWDELTRGADLVPAKHIFFIMDACYGGLAFLRTPSFGSMRFLGDMLQRFTRQALTAGKANETVSDGNGVKPGHSIFTAHLLEGLEGNAATEDGIITASGIMAYVYDRVGRDQYSHQTPHFGFVDGDGDFIFDTSLLIQKQNAHQTKFSEGEAAGETGDDDILINTSPQIVSAYNSKESVVTITKELLSDEKKKIELEDFVFQHVRKFLDTTDLRHFPVQGANIRKEEFSERLKSYEAAATDLQQILILLGKWGDQNQIQLLEKVFQHIAEADKGASGVTLWISLNWYPIQLLMYSAGISALSAKNYPALKIILETKVDEDTNSGRTSEILVPVSSNLSEIDDHFKWLPGHDRHYVPRSEYLFKNLQPTLEDLLYLGKSYEELFDQFEILSALDFAYLTNRAWGPYGRFGWKHKSSSRTSPFNSLVEEANTKKENWEPIKAGFFKGSFDEFASKAKEFKGRMDQLSWF